MVTCVYMYTLLMIQVADLAIIYLEIRIREILETSLFAKNFECTVIINVIDRLSCRRIDEGYDVKRISRQLDFINVMTYDLHGDWDNFADHHAPLHAREHDSWEFQSLNTVSIHAK